MRGLLAISILLILLLALDLYAWKGISSALKSLQPDTRKWVRNLYWLLSIGILVAIVVMYVSFLVYGNRPPGNASIAYSLVGVIFLLFLPKLVVAFFHLLEDLTWLGAAAVQSATESAGDGIPRARFLSQIGLALAAIPFGGVLYGITKGRTAFQIEEIDVLNPLIPKGLDGFRIVQISDVHLGSLALDSDLVSKGVAMINDLRADLILFTGDLVNNRADEAQPWIEQMAAMQAKHGAYSVLGNHDYGDYVQWESAAAKADNMKEMLAIQKQMGLTLLMDQHVRIEKDGAAFVLAGVQNYGGGRFPKYGNLQKALNGVAVNDFTLLMSHDPSHWDLQVRDSSVDLMVAGHTHGAQMGVKIANKRYSPSSLIYKQWAGMYTKANKQLYVNRGFGYLGFPGRVGMSPEITLFTLRSA